MKKVTKKLIIIFVGLFIALLFLEVVLRFIGYIHLKNIESDKIIQNKYEYTILCFGDSFTEGAGVSRHESYPMQLKNILQNSDKFKNKSINVINRGLGASNTSMIFDSLEEKIDHYNPDIVVVLAGGANFWNFWGYARHLKGKTFFSRMQEFLYEIRIYKLIRLVIFNFKSRLYDISLSAIIETKEEINDEKELIREIYIDRSEYYRSVGDFNSAMALLKEGKNKYPDFSELYTNLGIIYFLDLKNYNKARKYLMKAIKLDPDNLRANNHFALYFLQDPENIGDNLKFLAQFKETSYIVRDFLKILEQKSLKREIIDWITSDIIKIIELCRNNNIKLILQNYPPSEPNAVIISYILKDILRKHSVVFINHYDFFNNLLITNKIESLNYLLSDGVHCNEKGYRIMAENIYNKIIEERLIDFN